MPDVPSVGLTTRILGHKTGRLHIFFSELETAFFYSLEVIPAVADIREQFELPVEETRAIAEELNIRHPSDPKAKSLFPLTTDLVITTRQGTKHVDHARTVKYSQDLTKTRTLQKLELERVFWEGQGVSWGIFTELDISKSLVANSRWLHPCFTLSDSSDLTPEILDRIDRVLRPKILAVRDSLAHCAAQSDDELGLSPGTCLKVARHFLAIRRWEVDLNVLIDPAKTLQLLNNGVIHGISDQLIA